MFERFSGGARRVIVYAQEEARELYHDRIGTEHLLLGILHLPPEDTAARALTGAGLTLGAARSTVLRLLAGSSGEIDTEALTTIGIDFEAVREKVEAAFGAGALSAAPSGRGRRRRNGHIPFSSRAKKVLELSLDEARRLGSGSIEAAHLLLGVIREGEGLAARTLREHGIDTTALRRTLDDSLRPGGH